ncbi:amino acid transporter [Raoultella ornithinolytica]|nr:amino acid transporter [Raoultella ornithinolytica]
MFSKRLASHLERGVVGFPTTLASSVGLIMASPVILTVTSGFGMGGDTFALAVLLAFIMMQAQVTTFAEAATLIPTTGSVYDYIACGMGRFFAITGALCAYLIVHIFAGTAETILAGVMALVNFESISSQMAAHQNTWMVGVGMVVVFGLLNAIGVEIFGKVEVVLTFGMWSTLTIFGLCGIFMAPVTHLSGWFGTPLDVSDLSGLFGYIGMAMFMFVGCELVTPMAPEIKHAHRTIPRAMALGLLGVASCMFIYGAAINRQVENVVLDAANNVHLLDTPMAIPAFAERVMGHAGQYWLGVGLLLAGCATINTLMAAVPADYLRHGAGWRAPALPDLAASPLQDAGYRHCHWRGDTLPARLVSERQYRSYRAADPRRRLRLGRRLSAGDPFGGTAAYSSSGSASRLPLAVVPAAANYLQRRDYYRHHQYHPAGDGQPRSAGAIWHHARPDRRLCPLLDGVRPAGQPVPSGTG